MCKAFSAIVKVVGEILVQKVYLRIIDSFGNLSRLFVANFMSYRIR